MNIKDVIAATIDSCLASETGDIEIADDMQKTSAWLVALSGATIYFSFSQIQILTKPIDPIYVYGQLLVIGLLTLSFVSAYLFRAKYTTFRALCRNLVVARKILLVQLHENSDSIEKYLAESKESLWFLVQSGRVHEMFPSISGPHIDATLEKQVLARSILDSWFSLQRQATSLGLLCMVVVSAYAAYCKIAA